jgi:hypothetical protein
MIGYSLIDLRINVYTRSSYWASKGLRAGVRGGRAGVLAHYAKCKPGILDIFSEYSFKIPQIYLNMLKYTRIYLIFPC